MAIAPAAQRALWMRRQRGHILLFLTYVIVGRLGLLLAVPPGYATAIFPPAGIAVAAMFIGGGATLPWTFLASLVLNLWIGDVLSHRLDLQQIALAVIIATASALQAAVGGLTLRRVIGYPAPFARGQEILRFLMAAPGICLTSATVSLTGMVLLGAIDGAEVAASWGTWWIGDTLGVLMFLPLVMVIAGRPRSLWRSRMLSVALPMLLTFGLFVAIFMRVSAWENDASLLEFRLLSQEIADRVESRLQLHQALLEELRASFARPVAVSRQDFTVLVQSILRRLPSVQAIEWAPRIDAADRDRFEAREGAAQPGFMIFEIDASGHRQPAAARDALYPVTYLDPIAGNEAAIGFDLGSDAPRHAAIVQTVATGKASTTTPLRLVQETGDEAGMLLTLAVPDGAAGPGIVLAVLRINSFMDAVLGPAQQTIGVALVDDAADQPLYDRLSATGRAADSLHRFGFGGRIYSIRTAPTAAYFAQHRGWQSWGVLLVGVLGTSLLGALLMLSTGERQRVARLLTERTRERDRIWQVSDDLLGVGSDGAFTSTNPAWQRTLGWSEQELRSLDLAALGHPADRAKVTAAMRRLADGAGTVRVEGRFRHRDGGHRWLNCTLTAEGGLLYLAARNVTADKDAAAALRDTEEQLRQSQKMEAIGQLTGGIAHDFNNLLTVVIGNLDIAEIAAGAAGSKLRNAIGAAMGGAMRAAGLTQRLLAYAQKQPLQPRPVDLNQLVSGLSELVRRTQGEAIAYDFRLGVDLPLCYCDANQLETVLLNLVINARDAMPQGGRLTIATASKPLERAAAAAKGLAPGIYVTLAVSDTGIGMSRETLDRAFEPFFTTKGVGKGTGLGLSTVYGFVKQSNGHVEIDSRLGEGTTVRLLLPAVTRSAATPAAGTATLPATAMRPPGEAILVVEDDAAVRGFIVDVLQALQYRVLEAPDGPAALATIGEHGVAIDLLLTDVIMPGMDGRELANRARAVRPDLKILYMTGYSRDALAHQGHVDPAIALIEKPFRREVLAARVEAVLRGRRDHAEAT